MICVEELEEFVICAQKFEKERESRERNREREMLRRKCGHGWKEKGKGIFT